MSARLLARVVDIRRWLQQDRQVPFAERLERDRTIGRSLAERRPAARVLAWWEQVRSADTPADPAGDRVAAGRRLASLALIILGLLVGAGVGGVAFSYDGRYPVNLFTLLGVLVGVPLGMLLLTLLLLPGRLPGLRSLQSVAAGMSPGRWMGVWLDRFLDAELFAPGLLRRGGASAFSRWQLVVFSQWLALGFFAGALGIGLLLVTFTDLAFGWSTTLELSSSRVHAWVAALSAPWAGWLPQAAPDAELVAASRFFRLEEGRMPTERIELLGAWWPFVLMTMLVYGALPRLILLVVGLWRLRGATITLLIRDPEVTALLDRLDAPLVDPGGDGWADASEAGEDRLPAPREPVTARGLMLLRWNRAADADEVRRWLARTQGVEPAVTLDLGIVQSDAERRAALESARDSGDEPVRRVLLVTKGWEPPLLEFLDFLGLVREVLGPGCSITVAPLDVSAAAIRAGERDVWARALARTRDPALYVLEAEGEVTA